MIVVDTSAVVAILFNEPIADTLLARLDEDPDRIMSVASYVEAMFVLAGRRAADRDRAAAHLERFLTETAIRLAPVDEAQMRIAARARIQYGRGMGHGGSLNFGDTFSYALAIDRNASCSSSATTSTPRTSSPRYPA